MRTKGQDWKKEEKINRIKCIKDEFHFEFKLNNKNQIILKWNDLDR